jgi:2-amino-4-hydroxy-6-hydroxymethyldihydropteridine diphosphokinase
VPAEPGGGSGAAFIALGANLGDPVASLRSARHSLAELGEVTGASGLYRTQPVGGPPGQPPYVNAVIRLEPRTELRDPVLLLRALHGLELRHGRERRVRWEARTLDLDLLSFGNTVSTGELELPHPRMMERPFVLVPLLELAPPWRHPVSGVTAAAALAGLDAAGVELLPDSW